MVIPSTQFITKAREAQALGGALRLDKKGALSIQGTTWWGRKVLWLKDHLRGGQTRRQNLKLLSALSQSFPEAGPFLESLGHDAGRSPTFTKRIHDMLALISQKDTKPPVLEKIPSDPPESPPTGEQQPRSRRRKLAQRRARLPTAPPAKHAPRVTHDPKTAKKQPARRPHSPRVLKGALPKKDTSHTTTAKAHTHPNSQS